MKAKIILAFSLCVVLYTSCKKDSTTPAPTNTGTTKSFVSDVKPLMDTYCVSCHSSYSSYNGVYSGRSGIKSTIADGSMPKRATMSADQKNTVIGWIDGGAPNN